MPKLLITGSSGQLARAFQEHLQAKSLDFAAPPESDLDITQKKSVESWIKSVNPDIIINCAAYNAVDQAEAEPDVCRRINSEGPGILARLCLKYNCFLVHFSSDYVFDGSKQSLYDEEDAANPLNVYGQSKLDGEEAIKKILAKYLIFRLSWVFGQGQQNFLYKFSEWAKQSQTLRVANDEISVPTYTEDIVTVTMEALKHNSTGLYHLTNTGQASRYEVACHYVSLKGLENEVVPVPMSTFSTKAKRPGFSAMSNAKISQALGITIPTWQNAIDRYIHQ